MSKSFASRLARAAVGLAAVSAFAVAPMAAQAAPSGDVTGTLTGGSLSNTAPSFTPFGVTLSGVSQHVFTEVGAWSVTDATGSNAGWHVTVAASNPVVYPASTNTTPIPNGAGTGGSITLTAQQAIVTIGNSAPTAPVPASSPGVLDSTGAYTIDSAVLDTGQGSWDTPRDTGTMGTSATKNSLDVVIPADAAAGDYVSTLTFTSTTGP